MSVGEKRDKEIERLQRVIQSLKNVIALDSGATTNEKQNARDKLKILEPKLEALLKERGPASSYRFGTETTKGTYVPPGERRTHVGDYSSRDYNFQGRVYGNMHFDASEWEAAKAWVEEMIKEAGREDAKVKIEEENPFDFDFDKVAEEHSKRAEKNRQEYMKAKYRPTAETSKESPYPEIEEKLSRSKLMPSHDKVRTINFNHCIYEIDKMTTEFILEVVEELLQTYDVIFATIQPFKSRTVEEKNDKEFKSYQLTSLTHTINRLNYEISRRTKPV
jgi:hypothetical protein